MSFIRIYGCSMLPLTTVARCDKQICRIHILLYSNESFLFHGNEETERADLVKLCVTQIKTSYQSVN